MGATCLQPAADAADAPCALLVMLGWQLVQRANVQNQNCILFWPHISRTQHISFRSISVLVVLRYYSLGACRSSLLFSRAVSRRSAQRRENNGAASSVTRATSSVVRAAPRKSRYGLRGVKGAAVLFAALLWPGSPERGPAGESIVSASSDLFFL